MKYFLCGDRGVFWSARMFYLVFTPHEYSIYHLTVRRLACACKQTTTRLQALHKWPTIYITTCHFSHTSSWLWEVACMQSPVKYPWLLETLRMIC